jgi:hypothetical protein
MNMLKFSNNLSNCSLIERYTAIIDRMVLKPQMDCRRLKQDLFKYSYFQRCSGIIEMHPFKFNAPNIRRRRIPI